MSFSRIQTTLCKVVYFFFGADGIAGGITPFAEKSLFFLADYGVVYIVSPEKVGGFKAK